MPTARRTGRPAVGERIRRLRQARGLTQRQLAGDDFTVGLISQIESGYTRLSLRTAQLIAGRLGVPLAEVLGEDAAAGDQEQRALLLQAERELAIGSPQTALRQIREITGSPALRGRALRLRGRALLALDRAHEALEPLRQARADFRARGQLDVAARASFDIAMAHARLDETEEALLAALECERALGAAEVIDGTLDLKLRAFLASAYVRRGDLAGADAHIERALTLAEDISDREAQAALYASLARTEQERGNLVAAIGYWERSLQELEELGREHAVAETWHSLAVAYVERQMPNKASAALSRAEELARSLDHRRLLPWLQVTRARLALAAGRLPEAERLAMPVARDGAAPPRARAEALLLHAEALRRSGAPAARLRRAFEDAVAASTDQPASVRARVLRAFADALEAAGDAPGSLERMRAALDLVWPVTTKRA